MTGTQARKTGYCREWLNSQFDKGCPEIWTTKKARLVRI
jgi:hypothetical protein